MKYTNYFVFLFVIALFSSCADNLETHQIKNDKSSTERPTLTIGIVPQFAAKRTLSIWSPIIKALEAKTGYRFKIVGTPTIPDFETEFQKGALDIAYMNPYHCLVANKTQGYEAVLTDGKKSLFGVLVVRKDDPIKDIQALNNAFISFPAPNALGASLLMRTELKNQQHLDIQPVYVETHTNAYMNVVEGKTRAGGGVMGTFNELSDDIKSQLRVFYTTQKVPSHPIVVHPRVEEKVKANIIKAFLEIAQNPETEGLLKNIPIEGLATTNQATYQVLEKLGMENFYVNPN